MRSSVYFCQCSNAAERWLQQQASRPERLAICCTTPAHCGFNGWAERYEVSDVLRYSRASKMTGIGKGKCAQVMNVDAPANQLAAELSDPG
jgi:hypothetical protein